MSRRIRVFIISETPLINGNLDQFLDNQPEIEVVGEELSLLPAVSKIKDLKPHVIFWADSRLRDHQREILELLTAISDLKLIRLDLVSNTTKLYHSHHIEIKNIQNLLPWIKGDLPESNHPDAERD